MSEGVFTDFLAAREEKRAAVTDTVIAGQRREAQKAGVTLETALAYACEQGWSAFNAAWYADRTTSRAPGGAGPRKPAPENFGERKYVGGKL